MLEKGCNNGFLSKVELDKLPGVPNAEYIKKGPVAVVECDEEIPCNPCETCCPRGAISIGDNINSLPLIDPDLCTGCGICIASCPGLAIFVVDGAFSENQALVSIPYEFEPLPSVGDVVDAFDRGGEYICEAKIIKVRKAKQFDRTAVVSFSVPKEKMMQARHIKPKENNSNSNKMGRLKKHPILGEDNRQEMVSITVDGKNISAFSDEVIAAAIWANDKKVFRKTAETHQPRGVFCGIGICTDCIMTVNNNPNVRTCITQVEKGMIIKTQDGLGSWGGKD